MGRVRPHGGRPNAFPHRERLKRRSEFLEVYREGNKRVGRGFILFTVRGRSQGRKFGCAVSRKVGSAVVRNRVKRHMREVYRQHRTQLPEDIRMVLVARPESARFNYHQSREAILRLLRKEGVVDG